MTTPAGGTGPKSNWWMYHGDPGHTGFVASGSTISTANVKQLQLLHQLQLGGPVVSVPAIVDGYIYVGLANSHETESSNGGALFKIDIASGAIAAKFLWNLGNDLPDGHGFTGMGCTPCVVNGKVYFSAFNGKVYCLNASDLTQVWVLDLRHQDLAKNQPVTNVLGTSEKPVGSQIYSPPAGWSSPVYADGKIYVGIGEGENPYLYSFLFAIDAESGRVAWVYCTCQFEKGRDNLPNELPKSVVYPVADPPGFTVFDGEPIVRGCSPWSSIAYDEVLGRIFVGMGNAVPDGALPSAGYSNGVISLAAADGRFAGFFQVPAASNYRPSDNDIDVGASPTIFRRAGVDNQWPGTNPTTDLVILGFGCKNGSYFLLNAASMQLISWRQLLPYYDNGLQIPTVDPHQGTTQEARDLPGVHEPLNPRVTNAESNATLGECYHGTYSCAAISPGSGPGQARLFIGMGGADYNFVASGIDFNSTPFMRAIDWNTMADVWPFDDNDPKRYANAMPPMYTNPGECGLSSPAVVNDIVFCTTSKVTIYAFNTVDGTCLWQYDLGAQTEGYTGGYGFSMGPAVWGDYVVAGALVMGLDGGTLAIFGFKSGG
ncbi:MAG TPA: PQQ-binding-like beta-propeller repeat protein [Thermoanaerobaculia bacterium]|nr:PQQ-binding-like beta-propeller repeat protein [Thermoanaerobaculia bacterium]